MRHHFDLSGLREHVEGGDRDDAEVRLQLGQVAAEGRRIAGDVDQRCGRGLDNGTAHFSGSRRIGRSKFLAYQRLDVRSASLQLPHSWRCRKAVLAGTIPKETEKRRSMVANS